MTDFNIISKAISKEHIIDQNIAKRIEHVMALIRQLRFKLQEGVQQDEQRKDKIVGGVLQQISSETYKKGNKLYEQNHQNLGKKLGNQMNGLQGAVNGQGKGRSQQGNGMVQRGNGGQMNGGNGLGNNGMMARQGFNRGYGSQNQMRGGV